MSETRSTCCGGVIERDGARITGVRGGCAPGQTFQRLHRGRRRHAARAKP